MKSIILDHKIRLEYFRESIHYSMRINNHKISVLPRFIFKKSKLHEIF